MTPGWSRTAWSDWWRRCSAAGAAAAAPLVMDYLDGAVQSSRQQRVRYLRPAVQRRRPAGPRRDIRRRRLFVADRAGVVRKLGGFDERFFMYADEYDLCWRVWVAGGKVILAPSARVHHRGAAAVNPRGGERVLEARTSDTKRYYANRNNLVVLLKNSQHLLLAPGAAATADAGGRSPVHVGLDAALVARTARLRRGPGRLLASAARTSWPSAAACEA